MAEIFRVLGSILINNTDANRAIDDTTQRGQSMANTIGNTCSKAGQTMTNVGKKLAPVSLAVGGVLTASTKSANDFTNGMAKMSTLFDTTQTSVSDLSKQFLQLSDKTGLSATELAEAGYQALSAGQSVEQVGGFVETAGKLAKAGFTSTSTAVDVLTTAINAYGANAGTADEISNKLVRTQNLGKTTVDELASSMGKIIPTASAMGVNIDNLTSGYVSLTKQGIATAEATTYMNSMLNELGDSGTTLGGVLKEKTGKSFQELMASGMSLGDVLQITKDYADENNIAYNELWGSAEAGKAGLAILNGGVDEFNQTVGTMASKTDDVGEALDKLNTPTVTINKALNKLKNAGIELGTSFMNALAPTISAVCDGINQLASWFDGLPEPMKEVIAVVMALIAVASPLLIGVGKVLQSVNTIITVGSKLNGLISTIGGGLSSLWSILSANPIVLVIGAIVALVAGFVYLWNTSEDFRNFWINLWNAIVDIVSNIVDSIVNFFTNLWNDVTNIFNSLVESVTQIWDTIKNVIDVAIQLIVEIITVAFDLITLPFRFIWENCKETITSVWDTITNWLSDKFNAISNIFTTVWNTISSFLSGIWDGIKNTVSSAINAVSSVISNVMNTIKSVFTTIWNAISGVISSVWNTIKTTITNVMNTIKNTISNIWNSVKSTITGIIDGIKNSISDKFNAIKNTLSNILNGIKDTFSSVFNGIKSFVGGIVDWLKGIFHFEWNLPKIKLPHFSVSGSFSLNPPSIPHFGIDWYKKAMNQPYMFTKPTLFGTNSDGQPMGAGESGDEIMLGRNTMMEMIRSAVSAETSQMVQTLHDGLSEIISKMGDNKQTGDIVIPVYLGNNMMDEIIVDAKKRVTMRSGGLTNV